MQCCHRQASLAVSKKLEEPNSAWWLSANHSGASASSGPWAGCRAANLGLGRTDVAEDHPRQGHDPGLQLEYPSLPGQEPTLPCMRWLPSPALTSAGHFTH